MLNAGIMNYVPAKCTFGPLVFGPTFSSLLELKMISSVVDLRISNLVPLPPTPRPWDWCATIFPSMLPTFFGPHFPTFHFQFVFIISHGT